MKLRWKTFEPGIATTELPQDKLDKVFNREPTVIQYPRSKMPVLQVSYDDVNWYDVPSLPPIPYEEWSNE